MRTENHGGVAKPDLKQLTPTLCAYPGLSEPCPPYPGNLPRTSTCLVCVTINLPTDTRDRVAIIYDICCTEREAGVPCCTEPEVFARAAGEQALAGQIYRFWSTTPRSLYLQAERAADRQDRAGWRRRRSVQGIGVFHRCEDAGRADAGEYGELPVCIAKHAVFLQRNQTTTGAPEKLHRWINCARGAPLCRCGLRECLRLRRHH